MKNTSAKSLQPLNIGLFKKISIFYPEMSQLTSSFPQFLQFFKFVPGYSPCTDLNVPSDLIWDIFRIREQVKIPLKDAEMRSRAVKGESGNGKWLWAGPKKRGDDPQNAMRNAIDSQSKCRLIGQRGGRTAKLERQKILWIRGSNAILNIVKCMKLSISLKVSKLAEYYVAYW